MIPATIEYIGMISDSFLKLKEAGLHNQSMEKILTSLSELLDGTSSLTETLEQLVAQVPHTN